jgi:Uma2 family endonuclease
MMVTGGKFMSTALQRRKSTARQFPARVVFEGALEIPAIRSFDEFQKWARSAEFPEQGRIDYIDGSIEVDPVTEDALSHGSPKTELARVISNCVHEGRLGHAFIDATRVSCRQAKLSVEPDIVVVTHATLKSKRVRFTPGKSPEPRRYVELTGAPDLVVEVLSDSSVAKDTQRLFNQYFEAGVVEYWLADARGSELEFAIHYRGKTGFRRAPRDQDGFQRSKVLGARYRFDREEDINDTWFYTLRQTE